MTRKDIQQEMEREIAKSTGVAAEVTIIDDKRVSILVNSAADLVKTHAVLALVPGLTLVETQIYDDMACDFYAY